MTLVSPQQLLDFLCCAASYPHEPSKVALVQTHASWVFVASPFVYKVKKPVCFGFLDFSSLELRHADCEREIVLNRRLAGDIYVGVVPICESNGQLQFGGDGEVVEWVVKMREMDSRYFLSHLVREGAVGPQEIDRIVATLCRFYSGEPPLSATQTAAAADQTLDNVFSNLAYAGEHAGLSLSMAAFRAISTYANEFVHANGPLLHSRIVKGRFRDCHGDLHLEHIYLPPGDLRIYDCIEFNDKFRLIDIACDVAFLAMDLEFHGRPDLASHLIQRCASELHDGSLLAMMDFYKCYRASVRGKVESLHSIGAGDIAREAHAALDLAQRYYRLALKYAVIGSKPTALVIMGRVASGKSTLAHSLGKELGWPVHSSDQIRKELGGVPLHQRGDAQQRAKLYASEMSERVYNVMLERCLQNLRTGDGVILDATYSSHMQRHELERGLAQEGFDALWILVSVEEEAARVRLRERESMRDVISDAREEDALDLNARFEPPSEDSLGSFVSISSDTKPADTLLLLMEKLAVRNARHASGA